MSLLNKFFFKKILVLPCSEDESILFSFISVVMMAQSLQGAASSLASRTLLLEVEAIALLHNNKHYVHIIILYTTILYYSSTIYVYNLKLFTGWFHSNNKLTVASCFNSCTTSNLMRSPQRQAEAEIPAPHYTT